MVLSLPDVMRKTLGFSGHPHDVVV